MAEKKPTAKKMEVVKDFKFGKKGDVKSFSPSAQAKFAEFLKEPKK